MRPVSVGSVSRRGVVFVDQLVSLSALMRCVIFFRCDFFVDRRGRTYIHLHLGTAISKGVPEPALSESLSDGFIVRTTLMFSAPFTAE